jgi:hypothetical protein
MRAGLNAARRLPCSREASDRMLSEKLVQPDVAAQQAASTANGQRIACVRRWRE